MYGQAFGGGGGGNKPSSGFFNLHVRIDFLPIKLIVYVFHIVMNLTPGLALVPIYMMAYEVDMVL